MRIEVTKEDILYGRNKSLCDNPIAKAVKRAFPKAVVLVDWWLIVIDDNRYITSQKLRRFFFRFENGDRVRPFAFDLQSLELWYDTH